MNSLPYDVVSLIADELRALYIKETGPWRTPKLAQYAVINTTWNCVIERMSFQYLSVYSSDIPEKGPQRANHHGQVRADDEEGPRSRTGHPPLNKSVLSSDHAHSDEGQQENDECFSQSVRAFWKVLEDWQGEPRVHLTLQRVSIAHDPDLDLDFSSERPKHQACLSFIGEPLPRLRCVNELFATGTLQVAPTTLLGTTASLEGLKEANIRLLDENPADPQGDLGLREVSTRLRWIALRHVPVSSTLFWPDPRESAPQEEPWWPHLETFRISFAKLDPFGT
ncbi:hypothetical protein SLS55_000054 [Diplodia seriata]|uniref:F-box domain-containing protein n=1 Tax=Diplodia seriata TaxID=420778 RepID=A0ABR3CU49_9PEZI